jgi:hypothetical protein
MRDSDRRIARNRILGVIRSVKWRWRTRIALRGLVWVAALTGGVVLLSAMGLERMRFDPEAVVWLRVATWGTFAISMIVFLIRPLLVRVTDTQVALYLEEHEPSLEHAVVSALDPGNRSVSPELAERVLEVAVEKARGVQYGRRVEQSGLYRFAGALTAVAVLALAVTLFGPPHLRHGLSALLLPTVDPAEVNPYSVAVQPGDVTIARGSDQMIIAGLSGFESADASVFVKGESEPSFRRITMLPALEAGFEVMLLGVAEPTEYFVEATGVRSPTFTIDVADLPYVDQIDVTYHFPRYTGLPSRTIQDGGDVAALAGTEVELSIEPTMTAPGGKLILDGEAVADLEPQEDGTLRARFTIGENDFYSIQLARDNGALVRSSPEYNIDVLRDQDPSISFSRPGRDMPASTIEEVYLEVRANDDYGIGDIRLVVSVNAGPEDTISMFEASGAPLADVSTGHTLFLEEWPLEVGDLVSYYAIVRDNRSMGGDKVVTSDIYFLNMRPFERAYRQAEQQGGGGGGGGGMQQDDMALSELQRQVIAATFNLIRQRDTYSDSEFSENVVSVGLAQGRLRDQVGTLLQRMQNRGLTTTDDGFRDVSAVLPLAEEAMERAQGFLDDEELREALPDEQQALRYLQQAEETYERYVTTQQESQGGGGGGGQQAAEDLADLFELELDKLKNQYETVQRGQQQQADNEVDELLERLQELARRQEQEAERQRRRGQQSQGGASGGNQSQRDLAEETEEAARQLQRLARERNDQQLEETARNLQQAAEQMRQAATQSGSTGASEAGSALQRLEEARRRLEQARSERARRDAEEAISQVEDLQRQQREVQREVRELPTERTAERQAQIDRLRERKDQMTEAVQDLERQLDNAASAGRADNPEAARELQDAADHIRESKLKEKLQYSRGTIEQWDPQSATTLELTIESDLQGLRDELEQARGASTEREDNPLEEALDQTRDLVRGMEAMGRRLNEPSPQDGEQGQQGDQQGQQSDQQGQQSHEGQQGDQQDQEGQQGDQQGQQGQEGQQGNQQGQQGQQGNQQGQQGQGGQQGQQGQGGQQPGQGGNVNDRGGGGGNDGWVGDRYAGSRFGGATRGEPRRLTPEEIRQMQSEARERTEQVRDLSGQLDEAGYTAEELRDVLDAMARLEDDAIYSDPRALAEVHAAMLDRLKRVEFTLRRDVEGEADRRGTLSGSDEVPDGYRTLVEEYYRALARGGRSPGGS